MKFCGISQTPPASQPSPAQPAGPLWEPPETCWGPPGTVFCSVLQGFCSVLQCSAIFCSVLQCFHSVLQCFAGFFAVFAGAAKQTAAKQPPRNPVLGSVFCASAHTMLHFNPLDTPQKKPPRTPKAPQKKFKILFKYFAIFKRVSPALWCCTGWLLGVPPCSHSGSGDKK